jgi:hypothetical protein
MTNPPIAPPIIAPTGVDGRDPFALGVEGDGIVEGWDPFASTIPSPSGL